MGSMSQLGLGTATTTWLIAASAKTPPHLHTYVQLSWPHVARKQQYKLHASDASTTATKTLQTATARKRTGFQRQGRIQHSSNSTNDQLRNQAHSDWSQN